VRPCNGKVDPPPFYGNSVTNEGFQSLGVNRAGHPSVTNKNGSHPGLEVIDIQGIRCYRRPVTRWDQDYRKSLIVFGNRSATSHNEDYVKPNAVQHFPALCFVAVQREAMGRRLRGVAPHFLPPPQKKSVIFWRAGGRFSIPTGRGSIHELFVQCFGCHGR